MIVDLRELDILLSKPARIILLSFVNTSPQPFGPAKEPGGEPIEPPGGDVGGVGIIYYTLIRTLPTPPLD
jgi:hypothetical protein